MADAGLRFLCAICHTEQPCTAGHPLPSGSWICNDFGECWNRRCDNGE